jgi:dihydrofolate reductase
MMISLICAASQNGVIGVANQLPWHLPADLKRFKALTMGHPILMGRKTFESIGRPLAGRTNIVITRQAAYQADGCLIAPSLALPYADRIYLTLVHAEFRGDTFLFEIDPAIWREISREDFELDENNHYPYSFIIFEATNQKKSPSLSSAGDRS